MTTSDTVSRIGSWCLGALGALVAAGLVGRAMALSIQHVLPAYVPHALALSPQLRLVSLAAVLPIQLIIARFFFRKGWRSMAWGCLALTLFFAVGNVAVAVMDLYEIERLRRSL
jgi:hypothetical protein